MEDIRWKQRFSNFQKALSKLIDGLEIENPSDLEREGIIQRFEYTFDLSWKTLKDYLEFQGYQDLTGSRDSFRQAYRQGLISDGEVWMRMIESRNLTSHVTAKEIFNSIKEDYFSLFITLNERLNKESDQ